MTVSAAYLSLARTQLRFSLEYAAWAREAEHSGKPDQSRKYSREADRLREEARFHLRKARHTHH